jgi:hypothetical protein
VPIRLRKDQKTSLKIHEDNINSGNQRLMINAGLMVAKTLRSKTESGINCVQFWIESIIRWNDCLIAQSTQSFRLLAVTDTTPKLVITKIIMMTDEIRLALMG